MNRSEIIEQLLGLLDLEKIANTLESGDAVQIVYVEDDHAPSLEISGQIHEHIESIMTKKGTNND